MMKTPLRILTILGIVLILIDIFFIQQNIELYACNNNVFSPPMCLIPLFGFLPMSLLDFVLLLIGIILVVTPIFLSRKNSPGVSK